MNFHVWMERGCRERVRGGTVQQEGGAHLSQTLVLVGSRLLFADSFRRN